MSDTHDLEVRSETETAHKAIIHLEGIIIAVGTDTTEYHLPQSPQVPHPPIVDGVSVSL